MAQKKPKRITGGHKMSQWFIGIKSGINFTGIQPRQSHSEFSNIAELDGTSNYNKNYNKLTKNAGSQIGLTTTFAPFPLLYISLQPVFINLNYTYKNELIWKDESNPDNSLILRYGHTQSLSYLEIPLIFRVNGGNQKVKPFVQAGGFYGRLLNASKSVKTSGTDRASGGTNEFDHGTQTTRVRSLYLKSQVGVLGGGGISYNLGGIMVSLNANFKFGLNNIVDAKHRYSETRQLTGFGNVLDDVRTKNLEISFSCLFPLKFLTKSFEPIIL